MSPETRDRVEGPRALRGIRNAFIANAALVATVGLIVALAVVR